MGTSIVQLYQFCLVGKVKHAVNVTVPGINLPVQCLPFQDQMNRIGGLYDVSSSLTLSLTLLDFTQTRLQPRLPLSSYSILHTWIVQPHGITKKIQPLECYIIVYLHMYMSATVRTFDYNICQSILWLCLGYGRMACSCIIS